jgi:hypothetical protein
MSYHSIKSSKCRAVVNQCMATYTTSSGDVELTFDTPARIKRLCKRSSWLLAYYDGAGVVRCAEARSHNA